MQEEGPCSATASPTLRSLGRRTPALEEADTLEPEMAQIWNDAQRPCVKGQKRQ